MKVLRNFAKRLRGRSLITIELVRIFSLMLLIEERTYFAPRAYRARPLNKLAMDLSARPARLISGGQGHQPWMNEIEFLSVYRMQRKALLLLASKIEDHPVFHGRRGPKQEPVAHQLMTLL